MMLDQLNRPPIECVLRKKVRLKNKLRNYYRTISLNPLSPWESPVVLVKKKDGTYRFAVDYRKLNSVTFPISHPLPHFEDIVDAVGSSQAQFFQPLTWHLDFGRSLCIQTLSISQLSVHIVEFTLSSDSVLE